MATDSSIVGSLYVPLIMIILLSVMIYFHRHSGFKYLYIVNIVLFLVSTVCYFILINREAGEDPRLWINAIPFIWIIGIFGGYFLSPVSIGVFVIEHAQRHTWAKVLIGIIVAAIIVLSIVGVYLFMQGIQSLKSG